MELKNFALMDNDKQHVPCSADLTSAMRIGTRLLLRCNWPFLLSIIMEAPTQAYERQLAQLREQVTQIEDLKAELAELRERLSQKSSNSSKAPSADPP